MWPLHQLWCKVIQFFYLLVAILTQIVFKWPLILLFKQSQWTKNVTRIKTNIKCEILGPQKHNLWELYVKRCVSRIRLIFHLYESHYLILFSSPALPSRVESSFICTWNDTPKERRRRHTLCRWDKKRNAPQTKQRRKKQNNNYVSNKSQQSSITDSKWQIQKQYVKSINVKVRKTNLWRPNEKHWNQKDKWQSVCVCSKTKQKNEADGKYVVPPEE